jgi:hypothetical protein
MERIKKSDKQWRSMVRRKYDVKRNTEKERKGRSY